MRMSAEIRLRIFCFQMCDNVRVFREEARRNGAAVKKG